LTGILQNILLSHSQNNFLRYFILLFSKQILAIFYFVFSNCLLKYFPNPVKQLNITTNRHILMNELKIDAVNLLNQSKRQNIDDFIMPLTVMFL